MLSILRSSWLVRGTRKGHRDTCLSTGSGKRTFATSAIAPCWAVPCVTQKGKWLVINRWCLLALLALAARPVAAQNPIVRVQIYTDARPQGLDTARLDRPTWGVIRARVTRKDGKVDQTTAVTWRTQDSTKARLRLRKAQSVAIESPMSARLGQTRVTVDVGGKHDTLAVVVRDGITGLALAPDNSQVASKTTRQLCSWMVTRNGGRILTAQSARVSSCVQLYPNQ